MTSFTVENLGNSDDIFAIESITVSPEEPTPPCELQVVLTGTTNAAIKEGAYIQVVIKLGLIKIMSKQYDMFEELRRSTIEGAVDATINVDGWKEGDTSIDAGKLTMTLTAQLPKDTPRAKFKADLSFWNDDEADIAFLRFTLDMYR
jgi:hypothetical protein